MHHLIHDAAGERSRLAVPDHVIEVREKDRDAERPAVQVDADRLNNPVAVADERETEPADMLVAPEGQGGEPIRHEAGSVHDFISRGRWFRIGRHGGRRLRGPGRGVVASRKQRDERCLDDPALAQEVIFAHRLDALDGACETGLPEEVLDRRAVRGEQIAGARTARQQWDVAVHEIGVLPVDDLLELRARRHGDPQAVDESIALHGIPQHIGVVAFREEERVLPRGPQDDADVVVREAADRTIRRNELSPVRHQQSIRRGEAGQHSARVPRRIDRLAA